MQKLMKKKKIIIIVSCILVCAIILSSVLIFKTAKTNFIAKYSKNVNEYSLNINLDCENKTLDIQQEVNYINTTEDVALKSIYFHIYPRAFCEGVVNKPVSTLNSSKAYPNGENYGDFELKTLKVNNFDVSPRYSNVDKDILIVDLSEELLPKKSVKIYFEYSELLPNISHRYGYGENTINLGNFFLIACVYDENEGFFDNSYHYNGDPFYSDISNFNIDITYDSKYTLASTGIVISETTNENFTNKKISAKAVRDFAMILSDKFNNISENIDGIEINYYYYQDKYPEKSLQTCIKSVLTFNELFAKYPYSSLSICESNFVYGGMEYPNIVFISDNLENYEDHTYTMVHEIAHQWWYGVVGNNEFKYGFLDEGLTEYSTYLFFEKNQEYELNIDDMIKNTTNSYLLFIDVYKEVFGKVDTTMLRSLDEYNTEPEYIYMAYVKGLLMFDALNTLVGEAKFIKSLKFYYNENMCKNATPSDLIYAFNKVCGKDLESFFKSWFNGSVIIESL